MVSSCSLRYGLLTRVRIVRLAPEEAFSREIGKIGLRAQSACKSLRAPWTRVSLACAMNCDPAGGIIFRAKADVDEPFQQGLNLAMDST